MYNVLRITLFNVYIHLQFPKNNLVLFREEFCYPELIW